LNSKEKFQNQTKLQDPVIMIISAITQTLSNKDPPSITSRVELQTAAGGEAEAHTHQDICAACTKAAKPTIAPKIAPSTSTPNRKWTKNPLNLHHNYNLGRPTTPCNGLRKKQQHSPSYPPHYPTQAYQNLLCGHHDCAQALTLHRGTYNQSPNRLVAT
jgi:hypothetical protein